jgi:hypothetical protein
MWLDGKSLYNIEIFWRELAGGSMRSVACAILLSALSLPAGASAQAPARITLTYADLADVALPVPIAAQVRIRDAIALKPAQAVGVPPGRTRYFVEADIQSLIRGPADLAPRIHYLVDLPNGSDGSTKLQRKAEYLLLAAPGGRGDPAEVRLMTSDAQVPWTPDLGTRVRAMLKEAAAPGAAPPVMGVASAFYVPGTLPGESETQLFLLTDKGKPVSLNVLRRPAQQPQWAVALGEIVDEAAAPPVPDTLLWYRLACGLPRTLPPSSLAEADAQSAAAIRADYALVLNRLGPCERHRIASR